MDPVDEVPSGPQTSEQDFGQPVFGCMEDLNGPSSSEGETGPRTSEHDFGQPGASSSCEASDAERDVPGSTASESADPRTQKGSNLSRSWFSKEQATMSRASQEGSRRGEAPAELEIGEADAGNQTRSLVLSEAESSTEWYQAIERKDCKTLMTLLGQKGSALLLETGKAGRTALHVAAIQGSLELADTIRVLLIFKANLRDCLTRAIDGRCNMKAEEIAIDIIGYSCREEKKFTFKDLSSGEKAFTPVLEFTAEWQNDYKLTSDDIKLIKQIITLVRNKGTPDGRYKGLIDSFQQNVDYNFGRDDICGNLFLFHHACSRVDGREFVKDVIKHCRSGDSGDQEGLNKLMQLRDFQGRTPVHVAVALAPAKGRDDVLRNLIELLGPRPKHSIHVFWWREMSLWEYLGVRDGRGWTPLHLAAT